MEENGGVSGRLSLRTRGELDSIHQGNDERMFLLILKEGERGFVEGLLYLIEMPPREEGLWKDSNHKDTRGAQDRHHRNTRRSWKKADISWNEYIFVLQQSTGGIEETRATSRNGVLKTSERD